MNTRSLSILLACCFLTGCTQLSPLSMLPGTGGAASSNAIYAPDGSLLVNPTSSLEGDADMLSDTLDDLDEMSGGGFKTVEPAVDELALNATALDDPFHGQAMESAPPPIHQVHGLSPTNEIVVCFRAGYENVVLPFGTVVRDVGLSRSKVIRVNSAAEQQQFLDVLQSTLAIEFAEPDYPVQLNVTPNDPMLGQQWALPRLAAYHAWDVTQGDPTMKIAVLDSGVDYNHPDLQGRVIKGKDFINNDDDPMDDHGHGTHVAGIISAVANNGVGIAGIAPNSQILAVKVLGADGSGSTTAISNGILYAIEQGAKVSNLSLGASTGTSTMQAAVDRAVAAGIIVVSAAGNSNT